MVQQFVRTASLSASLNLIVVPKRKPVPYPHLLPPNATRWERAYGSETGRITALPVPVEDVWRFETCPNPALPWLAWAMSVDIWDNDWPDTQKRSLISESIRLHFKKGTLYAIRRYLAFAGAQLIQAIIPPDKAYPSKSLTDEERAIWLARFPQIRLFEFLNRGVWTYGAFVSGGAYKIKKTFFGDNNKSSYIFPYKTDAADRIGTRAFYWDQGTHPLAKGVNMPMRWIPKDRDIFQNILLNYEQGFVPTTEVQAVFLTSDARTFNFHGRMFPLRSEAPARIFSVVRLTEPATLANGMIREWALSPKLRPIEMVPEKIAEPGTMKLGVHIFLGMPGRWLNPKTKTRHKIKGFLLGYLPPSTAYLRLFDRIHLHDPARLPDGRTPGVYLNHIRLGLPAYHAILATQIRGRRTLWQANQFVYGHTVASDMRHLAIARDAVLRSKAQRDKILIKTTLTKTITTKLGIKTTDGFRSGQTALTL